MSNHPPDPKYFNVQRARTTNHQKNNNRGYKPTNGTLPKSKGETVAKGRPDKDYCQIHHILPVSSVQDASIREEITDKKEYSVVRKCFGLTKWDVDQTDNVIGLPLKRAFIDSSAPKKDLWNLPCHMYGHPQYTKKVKKDLKKLVWDPILKKADPCPPDYEAIKKIVENASSVKHTWLITRGAGTENNWKNRRKLPDTWHIPFSMDPKEPPPRVKPPPTLAEFANDMKEALSNLFKKQ